MFRDDKIIVDLDEDSSIVVLRSLELVNALKLYNESRYFHAHEILEDQWKKETGAIKIYFHALIQICLALVKVFEKPNEKGAKDQSERAYIKLDKLLSSNELTKEGRVEIIQLRNTVKQLNSDLLAKKKKDEIIIPKLGHNWKHLFKQNGNS